MAKKQEAGREVQLAEVKLAASGLTIQDAQKLGIRATTPAETNALNPTFRLAPALHIPYFDLQGKPMLPWPKHPQFFRIRYLEDDKDFQTLKGKKPQRYAQPADSGVAAYFPKIKTWPIIANDPDAPIIITEGELKAAKACVEGFSCIGLGGVYNYKSANAGLAFLPELEKINWVKRTVYICFDSDFKTNPMVCQAIIYLADELMLRGAYPQILILPEACEGQKTGLDDFLLAQSPGALSQLMISAVPLTLAKPLFGFNNTHVYVKDPGLIIVQKTGQKIAPAAFKDHAESTQTVSEQVLGKDGTIQLRKTSAAGAWLKWPLRAEASRLTYQPGAKDMLPGDEYNLWKGWGCEPKFGDVAPFLELLDHLFEGADKGAKEWFLRWLAYPLQYPGIKMFSSVLMYGIKHGTGKSLLAYTMAKIYGDNFTELNQRDLHGGFNEWAICKNFVLADDVTGTNNREDADILKKLITQKTLRVNQKFVPSYEVPDVLNYFWTSNQPDAVFLEDDDRRYFIHEVKAGKKPQEFYMDYALWLDGGGPALFDYLLKLELGDFNPAGPAFSTDAKSRMIHDVKSELGAWVSRLMAQPDQVLRVGDSIASGDLFSTRQLLAIYDPTQRTKTTANGLGRELHRSSMPQVLDGQQVRTTAGIDRYYIVRNADKWLKASKADVLKHLEALYQPPVPKEKKY